MYSVKSGYKKAMESDSSRGSTASSSGNDQKAWKALWNANVQPKIKHFVWKILNGAISTRKILTRRRVCHDSLCPICANDDESSSHLFLKCNWVRAVWFGSPLQWVIPNVTGLNMKNWCLEKMDELSKMDDDNGSLLALFFNII